MVGPPSAEGGHGQGPSLPSLASAVNSVLYCLATPRVVREMLENVAAAYHRVEHYTRNCVLPTRLHAHPNRQDLKACFCLEREVLP